jgi:hypothetical protein
MTSGVTVLNTGLYYFNCVHIGGSAVVTISGAVTLITQCFTLDAGATINGIGEGYWGNSEGGAAYCYSGTMSNPGSGPGAGQALETNDWYTNGGGGHGGAGGADHNTECDLAKGGSANDDPVHPSLMGSGGGIYCSMAPYTAYPFPSWGGALLMVVVYDPVGNKVTGPATVNGTIDMSGQAGCGSCGPEFEGSGGGAGGTILIEAGGITGTGLLQANGGSGQGDSGAGGGGGIISLIEGSTSFPGTLSVAGGKGSANNTNGCVPPSEDGSSGSVTFTAPPGNGY